MNTNNLMSSIKALGGKIRTATAQYVPAMLSEDKRFSNAYSAILALLVCADLMVESDETISALKFIQDDQFLKSRGLVLSSLEYYGNFVDDLSDTFYDHPSYLVKKAKVIQEHVSVSLSNEYKAQLLALCNKLVGINANAEEKKVYDEIVSSLS